MTTPHDEHTPTQPDSDVTPPQDEDQRVDSETPPPEPDSTRADEAASGAEPGERVTESAGEDPGDLALGTSREDLT